MIPPSAEIAITFELLPERIQLIEAVLSGAGLESLVGSTIGIVRGAPSANRAVNAERWALAFAGVFFVGFILFAVVQAVS